MELLTLSKLICYFENIVIDFKNKVDFTDKISNQLLKDIEILSSLKRYISSH